MAADNFTELIAHRGHKIEVVSYGEDTDPVNVAVECEDCHEVLFDYDRH